MLHRHTQVKFRDNQENRVGQFPKTPKNANVQSSNFVTPAPRPRIALGAKSTNVHHRQFTSAKTGKRHSPITATKQPLLLKEDTNKVEGLQGGVALRAALSRALLTGIDVPDVEYCPLPVEPMPDCYEPDSLEPMDENTMRYLRAAARHRPAIIDFTSKDVVFEEPKFEFIEQPGLDMDTGKKATGVNPTAMKKKHVRPMTSSRLGGFAAPTMAAQAKAKAPLAVVKARTSTRQTTKPREGGEGRSVATLSESLRSLQLRGEASSKSATPQPGDDLSDIALPEMEIEWDV